MKPILKILKWSSCLLLITGTLNAQLTIEQRQQNAQKVEKFYRMAVKAYKTGNIRTANRALKSALTLNRAHANSIALLRRMKLKGKSSISATKRKILFSEIIIPVIDIDDATFIEAIEVLKNSVEHESKGKIIANFVIQDKGKHLDSARVTLKLKNVPAGHILRYILRSGNAAVKFGKYTTIIRPRKTTRSRN